MKLLIKSLFMVLINPLSAIYGFSYMWGIDFGGADNWYFFPNLVSSYLLAITISSVWMAEAENWVMEISEKINQ